MRVVVTGATGNIGTAVLRRLAADGHDLVGLARRVPGEDRSATSTVASTEIDGVEWLSVDLTVVDLADLVAHLQGADAVVHLAWGFQPSHDLGYLAQLGIGGTRRVVDAVVAAGVPHLVHMSSVGAYSPRVDDAPVDESWPTEGVPTSRYSRHKAAAERILDELVERSPSTLVTRLRPGIVGQRSAGSALLRYGVPALVPARVVRWLPVLPLDRGLTIPAVHSDDVADAVARVLDQGAIGAFNLASDVPVTAQVIADVLGARLVHVPSSLMRPVVSAAWHLRLQQLDTGWLDLAFAVPLMDTQRARTELGWRPEHDGPAALREVVDGMADAASGPSAVLRPRTVAGAVGDALRRGVVSRRPKP